MRARWTARLAGLLLLAAGAARAAEPVVLDVPVFQGGYGIAFYEETARLF